MVNNINDIEPIQDLDISDYGEQINADSFSKQITALDIEDSEVDTFLADYEKAAISKAMHSDLNSEEITYLKKVHNVNPPEKDEDYSYFDYLSDMSEYGTSFDTWEESLELINAREKAPVISPSASSLETAVSDINKLTEMKKEVTYSLTDLSDSKLLGGALKAWFNRNNGQRVDALSAQRIAKEHGVDIKFNEDILVSDLYESIHKKQLYDNYINHLQILDAVGARDLGALKNLGVWWAGVRGGFSAADLALGLGAGAAAFFAPAVVAGVASGLLAVRSAATVGKIATVTRSVNTLKNVVTLNKAAQAGNASAKLAIQQLGKLSTGFWGGVESVSTMSYNNLGVAGKAIADAASWAVVDILFANAKLNYAKNSLQWDLYSEMDRNLEIFTAFGLGAVLPTGVRAIGATVFKKLPPEVWARKFQGARRAVAEDLQKGKITEEEAIERVQEINKNEAVTMSKLNKGARARTKAAEYAIDTDRIVLGSDTAQALKSYIEDCVREGKAPTLAGMPKFEMLLSNIPREYLTRILEGESIAEVLGEAFVVRKDTYGVTRAKVDAGIDSGMLASREVAALSEAEASELAGKLYRGVLELVVKGTRSDELLDALRQIEAFKAFTEQVENIVNKYLVDAAKPAKNLASKQPIYNQLRQAFLNYKMRGDAKQVSKYKSLLREKYRLEEIAETQGVLVDEELVHSIDNVMPENWKGLEEEFQEWFSSIKHLNKEDSVDMVLALKEAAEDNEYLAHLDEAIANIEYERLSENGPEVFKLTKQDMDKVLELTRLREAFMEETPVTAAQRRIRTKNNVSKARFLLANLQRDPEWSEEYKFLSSYHKDEGGQLQYVGQNQVPFYLDMIEKIQHFMNPKMAPADKPIQVHIDNIGEKVMDALSNSRAFKGLSERVTKAAQESPERVTEVLQSSLLSYKYTVHDTLMKVLKDSIPAFGFMPKKELAKIVSQVSDSLLQDIEKDPRLIQWITTPLEERQALVKQVQSAKEGLGELEDTPLGRGVERELSQATEQIIEPERAFKEMKEELVDALGRLELMFSHNVRTIMEIFHDMNKNPAKGAEIITGRATVSHELGEEAALSVDTKTKGAFAFVRAFELQLKSIPSTTDSSKSLYDIYKKANKETMNRIQELRIRKRWGEEIQENTDEARIANAIDDMNKAYETSFAKYGLSYTDNVVALDSHKLSSVHKAMPDMEMAEFANSINKIDIKSAVARVFMNLERDAKGLYRSGDRFVQYSEALKSVKGSLVSIAEEIKELTSITNLDLQRKALILFRDMDLDKMFVGDGEIRALSLNEVRDAVVNGKIAEYIGNDVYKARQVAAAIKEINTVILGKKIPKSKKVSTSAGDPEVYRYLYRQVSREGQDVRVTVGTSGRALTFKPGQRNIRAREEGKIAGAIADYEGLIHLKDADTEIKYMRLFGYDTLENQVQQGLRVKANVLASFENFGLDPIKTARELIDAFNTYQATNPYAKAYRAKISTDMYGKPIEKEAYSIRPGQVTSVLDNVRLATGQGDAALSAVSQVVRAIRNFITAGRVAGAAISSIADVGTAWTQMWLTGYYESTPKALMTLMRNYKDVIRNKDNLDLFIAAHVLRTEDFTRLFNGEFTTELMDSLNTRGWADTFHEHSLKFSELVLNKVGMLQQITNTNKKVTALAMQMAIGDYKGRTFKQLNPKLQETLRADGIEEMEWDFICKHLIVPAEEVNTGLGSRNLFLPQRIIAKDEAGNYIIPDEAIREALVSGGYKHVTSNTIDEFRESILTRTWVMIDNEADIAINVPSHRVLSAMRLHQPEKSGTATALETATQFKSFAFTATYNVYGRLMQRAMRNMPGVTVWDFFNSDCRSISKDARIKLLGGVAVMAAMLAPWEIIAQLVKQELQGKRQNFTTEDGKLASSWARALSNVSYIGSDFVGFLYDLVVDQKPAGEALTGFMPPMITVAQDTAKRLGRWSKSKTLPSNQKGKSFAAGVGLTAIDILGLARGPITARIINDNLVPYLEHINRGSKAYRQFLIRQGHYGYDVEDRSYYPEFGEGFKRMFRR